MPRKFLFVRFLERMKCIALGHFVKSCYLITMSRQNRRISRDGTVTMDQEPIPRVLMLHPLIMLCHAL